MRNFWLLMVLCVAASCHSATQTSSGQDYLARHPVMAEAGAGKTGVEGALREIANVEPTLTFPARIGLARIDAGRLSAVPGDEAEAWFAVRDQLGAGYGEFVPLSPMVAALAAQSTSLPNDAMRADVINQIRMGAARQHLDVVLVYEAYSKTDSRSNLLSIADLTIIGAYLLPSKMTDAEGFASAILIDVMQGYPYATVNVSVEKESTISSRWGWGSDSGTEMGDRAKNRAVVALSKEIEATIRKLRTELETQQHQGE